MASSAVRRALVSGGGTPLPREAGAVRRLQHTDATHLPEAALPEAIAFIADRRRVASRPLT
jgi:hypothetical protein